MKFSLLTVLPVFGLLGFSIANPVASSALAETSIRKRQNPSDIAAQLQKLLDDIKVQTKAISKLTPPKFSSEVW